MQHIIPIFSVESLRYEKSLLKFDNYLIILALSSGSAPMQIVDFLNDLWTVFDDTIAKYNIYKVIIKRRDTFLYFFQRYLLRAHQCR